MKKKNHRRIRKVIALTVARNRAKHFVATHIIPNIEPELSIPKFVDGFYVKYGTVMSKLAKE